MTEPVRGGRTASPRVPQDFDPFGAAALFFPGRDSQTDHKDACRLLSWTLLKLFSNKFYPWFLHMSFSIFIQKLL